MDALRYLRASELSPQDLVMAFNRSFEGYFVPMVHTAESLRALVEVNDVSLPHSLAAVDDQGQWAGIALLARRDRRGWVGGMGLAPQWRGRGAAAPLMRALLAEARSLGLTSVGLEVLAQNTPARRLYTSLSFQEVRSLAVFTGPLTDDLPELDASLRFREIPVERALADFDALHQIAPPWQREMATLAHMAPSLHAIALIGGAPDDAGETLRASLIYMSSGLGYSIMDAGSRAKTPGARRDDLIALVRALVAHMPGVPVRAINVPPGDALGDALTALGCPTPHTQWEMALALE